MTYGHLTKEERYQIYFGVCFRMSVSALARWLRRSRSTIERELARLRGRYDPDLAQRHACRCAKRSRANRPRKTAALWRTVRGLIYADYSPEQVRGFLHNLVSTSAIYRHVSAHRRRDSLKRHLRLIRLRPWTRRQQRGRAAGLPRNRPRIDQRPKYVLKRRQIGHWEVDTIAISPRGEKILTLVERRTRYTCVRKVGCGLAQVTGCAIVRALRGLPVRSLTFDNGSEFAQYAYVAQALNCRVYFAFPRHPEQRPSVENTNGLLRQYLPRSTRASQLAPKTLQRYAAKLNHRPRKVLGFLTPHQVLFA